MLSSIQALDLKFIVDKLSSEHYELATWPRDLAEQVVELYRRFLTLNAKYPGEHFVPTADIDECWHLHILNTKRYHEDCEKVFGHYLHHAPANPDNEQALEELIPLFEHTQKRYLETFNEELLVLEREALE